MPSVLALLALFACDETSLIRVPDDAEIKDFDSGPVGTDAEPPDSGHPEDAGTIEDASVAQCGALVGSRQIVWSDRAPMTTPRVDFATAVVGNHVYTFGGSAGAGSLSLVEAYDTSTDSWIPHTSMPTARRHAVAATIAGKIYVVGGISYTDPNNVTYQLDNEEYDPVSDTWRVRAPLPQPLRTLNRVLGNYHIAGDAVGDKLIVATFGVAEELLTTTYEYDPATDTWTARASSPITYSRLGAVGGEDHLYVIDNWVLEEGSLQILASYRARDEFWAQHPPCPRTREQAAITRAGPYLLIAGGRGTVFGDHPTDGSPLGYVDVYDTRDASWFTTRELQHPRHSLSLTVVDGRIYAIGGSSSAGRSAFPVPSGRVEEGCINFLSE